MFVPIVGIISPSNVDASASILLIAGVALGGRASLFGPALGAMAVGYGQSHLALRAVPDQWTYFQGALFIVVILFLPTGSPRCGRSSAVPAAPPTAGACRTGPRPWRR